MKSYTNLQIPGFTARLVGMRTATVLSAALLAACGGGGAGPSTASDSAISLATVTTGYTTKPTATTVFTPSPTTSPATVTAGAVVTDVRVQNTGNAGTNVPFTFGQVFAAGQLQPTEGLAAKLADGTVLPLQLDVKATHADGSVRHGVVSGVLPTLAAGQTVTVQLAKSSVSAPSSATPQSLLNAGLSSDITITIDNVKYTASLADAVAAGAPTSWLSGAIASEWMFNAPLKNAAGAVHPRLTARFAVRWYSGLSKQARVEVVVENDKTFISASNLTYDVNVNVGGRSIYAKTGLTHYHRARWHQTAWWDAATAPDLNIQLNAAYLIASKAVSNYDQSVVPSERGLAALGAEITSSNTGPMTIGQVNPAMGGTGGRPDIGPMPAWSVMYLLSGDQRARKSMMAAADGSGSWSMHLRDENTGYPVRTDNEANKRISTHPNLSNTGPLPVPRCVNDSTTLCTTPYQHEDAHTPALVYLPYLVTGDYYYLEELHFWAVSSPLGTDPNNSGLGQGLLRWQQVRGQAWSLRTLGQAAYITPDSHPLKAYFSKQLDNNLDFYNATYVVGNPNNLGVYDGSGVGSYQITEVRSWMDDFLTWSFGYLSELGFSKATPILQWKAKYPVGRMTAPGYCWIQAAVYVMGFRATPTSPIYNSFADLYAANFGFDNITNDNGGLATLPAGLKYSDLPCASQAQADYFTLINGQYWAPWKPGHMTGYAESALGYPENMQPALAVAASSGIPNAAQAWQIFNTRPAKPDYSELPVFAIIPR